MWLETHHSVPMSYIERVMAKDMHERRRAISEAEREAQQRCTEAYLEAKAEAERVGHRGPFDDLTRRMHAGEFKPKSEYGRGSE
jgi:hypothetical protein